MREKPSVPTFSIASTVVLATLTVLLVACGDNAPLSARAAEAKKEAPQPSVLDPALNRLNGVIHHG